MGLTRKGKGTKLMVVTDGAGVPVGALIESAQKAEIRLAEATLARVRVARPRGRPRTRPGTLVADKGYDSEGFRKQLWKRGIRPCIPRQRNRRAKRGPKPDLSAYTQRWIVERTFAWLGNYRRLVVRYERLPHIYFAFVLLAFILICSDRLLK